MGRKARTGSQGRGRWRAGVKDKVIDGMKTFWGRWLNGGQDEWKEVSRVAEGKTKTKALINDRYHVVG